MKTMTLKQGLSALMISVLVPPAADAGKGGGGKGGGSGNDEGESTGPDYVCRLAFRDAPGDGLRSDLVAGCIDEGDPVFSGIWDYWDFRDNLLVDAGCVEWIGATVSEGGAVNWGTTHLRSQTGDLIPLERWFKLDFNNPDLTFEGTPLNPALDSIIYGENDPVNCPVDPTPGVDNVEGGFIVTIFDSAQTHVALSISIRKLTETGGEPTAYALRWVNPVHVVSYPGDPDIQTLTTTNPATGQENASLVELRYDTGKKVRGTSWVTLGRYYMPFECTLRRVRP